MYIELLGGDGFPCTGEWVARGSCSPPTNFGVSPNWGNVLLCVWALEDALELREDAFNDFTSDLNRLVTRMRASNLVEQS